MEVILLQRIAKLGQMGDVVRVKDGFARNYLLPQGKALRANEASRKRFERDKVQLEARNLEARKEAEGVAEKLTGQTFVVLRQAGETGQLYGSVSTRDIAEVASAGGFTIERSQVRLDRAIKAIGLHEVHDRASPGSRGADHHQRRPLRRRGRAPGARRGSDDTRRVRRALKSRAEAAEAEEAPAEPNEARGRVAPLSRQRTTKGRRGVPFSFVPHRTIAHCLRLFKNGV